MQTLKTLLENRWIVKFEDPKQYYSVKDEMRLYRDFLDEKLGYNIISQPNVIKLEKIPSEAQSWMGITQFSDKMQYAFLCIILMFLEDKLAEYQFILSQLIDYIRINYKTREIDWTVYSHRTNLVKVLNFCVENKIIKVNDGDDRDFKNNPETEVLYENTGISRYFMRNFTQNIMEFNSIKDFENLDFFDRDTDRGIIRRQRNYRSLLLCLGVYRNSKNTEDFIYIKNYKSALENDFEKYLGCSLHVHKNSAYLVYDQSSNFGICFPQMRNSKSEISLLIFTMIRQKIREKILFPGEDERIIMTKYDFMDLVNQCQNRYSKGFVKSYREMKKDEFYKEIFTYMKDLNIISEEEDYIIVNPIAGKVDGVYPVEFLKEKGEESAK